MNAPKATGSQPGRSSVKPETMVRTRVVRVLVNDYQYPSECIQEEVPITMGSGTSKRADIVVYDDKKNIIGIVETKAPTIQKGAEQLKSYMHATSSLWGLWTNGSREEHFYKEGHLVKADPTFQIPKHGEAPFLKNKHKFNSAEDLVPSSDLKLVFEKIKKMLYANTNLSRTEKQGAEMTRLLFCKIYDEMQHTDKPRFQVAFEEKPEEVKRRIGRLWEDFKKDPSFGKDIFKENEVLELDDKSLTYVVKELQQYRLLKTKKDVIGEAFEVFASKQFAGEKGQFFTPRLLVKMTVQMISPKKTDEIIDVACGSGGFLIDAYNFIKDNYQLNAPTMKEIAIQNFYGIDKDPDLVKICKAYMCLMGDGRTNIVQADSLKSPEEHWNATAKSKLLDDNEIIRKFDVIITNPPFGSKIKIVHDDVLRRFDFGHQYKESKEGNFVQTNKIKKVPPQILFLELCLKMLKPNGKLGIILPDGIFGNPTYTYIRQYLIDTYKIISVVDCHQATFQPFTGNKTTLLVVENCRPDKTHNIFMGIVKHCGHTNRGKPILDENGKPKEDFSAITQNYLAMKEGKDLGFYVAQNNLKETILSPLYYSPTIQDEIASLVPDPESVTPTSLLDLENEGLVEIRSISASPASEETYEARFGAGKYRFIKTSDVFHSELNKKPLYYVTKEAYAKYKSKQDLREHDIVFVKDGNHKIGECVLLEKEDLDITLQGHFYKIRCTGFDPYLLFYLLGTEVVKKQIRYLIYNQGTLWSIGSRIKYIQVFAPKEASTIKTYVEKVKKAITQRKEWLRYLP